MKTHFEWDGESLSNRDFSPLDKQRCQFTLRVGALENLP